MKKSKRSAGQNDLMHKIKKNGIRLGYPNLLWRHDPKHPSFQDALVDLLSPDLVDDSLDDSIQYIESKADVVNREYLNDMGGYLITRHLNGESDAAHCVLNRTGFKMAELDLFQGRKAFDPLVRNRKVETLAGVLGEVAEHYELGAEALSSQAVVWIMNPEGFGANVDTFAFVLIFEGEFDLVNVQLLAVMEQEGEITGALVDKRVYDLTWAEQVLEDLGKGRTLTATTTTAISELLYSPAIRLGQIGMETLFAMRVHSHAAEKGLLLPEAVTSRFVKHAHYEGGRMVTLGLQ